MIPRSPAPRIILPLLLALPVLGSLRPVRSASTRPPNVLLIVADDLGYGDLGFNGCRDIPTPHIDSLAANGVRCTDGYVTGPVCSPTRAGLLTGRYQQRFGHEFNPAGPPSRGNAGHALSIQEVTFPQRMQAAGYRTAMVGKWHLGHPAAYRPHHRGFLDFFGFLGGSHSYRQGPDPGLNAIRRGDTPEAEGTYLTQAFAREACAHIERSGDQPWFLYVTFNAVHTPMHAAPDGEARFPAIQDQRRRTYASMLAAMDDAVGAMLASLRKRAQEDRTLIFFISDNGGPPVNASTNGPLRGYKGSTWEGGIRVPFVAQWKGTLPEGKTFRHPVIQLDLLPTALAAAGAEIRPEWELDGVDLLPYLHGRRRGAPHKALYWRSGPQMAIRMGDWKLLRTRQDAPPVQAVATGSAATVRRGRVRPRPPSVSADALLYNLTRDPSESVDLSDREPRKLEELQRTWDTWAATLRRPAWGPAAATISGTGE